MNLKKEKEMFEEWYEEHHNGRQISCDYVYEDNSYSIGYANVMWISWQASANRGGYKLVPVEPTRDMLLQVETSSGFNFEIPCGYENIGVDADTARDIYKAMIGEETK